MIRSLFAGALHVALVLSFTGRPAAAVAYFVGAAGLVLIRRIVPPELRRLYLGGAMTALVALTLWFRSELPMIGYDRVDRVLAVNLSFLGLSYAFLRTARAILAPRDMAPLELLRYWFFFPTFFSGPVVEPPASPLGPPELPARRDLAVGAGRICRGVVLVAASYLLLPLVPLGSTNNLSWSLERWSGPALLLGAFGSGVWLYLNFSGFSEVFIGASRALGVRVPENFARPYRATDLTDFWQRWHISLGTWLRATIYTPLSRRLLGTSAGLAAIVVPLLTMVVCGAWHGLEGPFLVWGGLHGLGLAVHQLWRRSVGARVPAAVREGRPYRVGSWLVTHTFISLTWVFFLPVSDLTVGDRMRVLAAVFGGAS